MTALREAPHARGRGRAAQAAFARASPPLLLPTAPPIACDVFSDIAIMTKPNRDLVPEGDGAYLKAIAGKAPKLPRTRLDLMAEEKKRKTSPAEFVNQVRTEMSKVVWPTREETIRTSIFVFIFMVILSLFFFGIDSLFNAIVKFLLTLA